MILEICDQSTKPHRLGEGSTRPSYCWGKGWQFRGVEWTDRGHPAKRIRIIIEDDR